MDLAAKVMANIAAAPTTSEAQRLRHAKLVDGANQFEAMMLQQMLKSAKFGEAPGTEGDDSSDSGNALQGYGTEALSKAIASSGGFGMARQIVRQVDAEDARKGGKV
jgi:Rod binding domain-containing protein